MCIQILFIIILSLVTFLVLNHEKKKIKKMKNYRLCTIKYNYM